MCPIGQQLECAGPRFCAISAHFSLMIYGLRMLSRDKLVSSRYLANIFGLVSLAIVVCCNAGSHSNCLVAQDQIDSPQQRGRPSDGNGRVYKSRIETNWSDDGNRFWYRNDLANRQREFIVVDAVAGTRTRAFDAELVAKKMSHYWDATFQQLNCPSIDWSFLAAKAVVRVHRLKQRRSS